MAATWTMRSTDTVSLHPRRNPARGSAWRLRYVLTGAAQGAPRAVDVLFDGTRTKAVLVDAGTAWMWDESAIVVDDGTTGVRRVTHGVAEVYDALTPETVAVLDADRIGEWLDPSDLSRRIDGGDVLGLPVIWFAGKDLRVAVDPDTGFVLRLEHRGERGHVLIEVVELEQVGLAEDSFQIGDVNLAG